MMRAPPALYRTDSGAAPRPPLLGCHQPPNEPPQKPTTTTAGAATVLPPPPPQVGGQRMALKLATQPKQQQPSAPCHRWPQPPPPDGQHSIQQSPIQRHPIHNYVSGCQAPECLRADEDDDLLLSDSNCSCSNSLECLVSSQHSPGVGCGGGHLYHSQATTDTTTTTFINHPSTFHNHRHHHHQRGPNHSPPTPPPPPQPLIGQNTYTATSDTITDSMLESTGVQHHRHHLQQHHHHQQHHQHQAASLSQASSDFAQVAPNYQTMSLGRHHHHQHHQQQQHPASHQHQHLMDHHQPHLIQHHHHQNHHHHQQQQQQLCSTKQINGSQGNLNTPTATTSTNKTRQTVSFRRSQTLADQQQANNKGIKDELDDKQQSTGSLHRQRAGGQSVTKDNSASMEAAAAGATPANNKQQRQQARNHPGDTYQRPNTCPVSPSAGQGGSVPGATVAMGATVSAHHQLRHQNNVAIYPPQTPLAPVGGATSMSPPGAGRISAHLLADTFDGPIGSPLAPIASHRTNSPWMRISSIILTPVGIVIVLFIVVSPLLHYLM